MATTPRDVAVVPTLDEYEARLAQLWERNLRVSITSGDDYFENGGDSLLGTQLLTWIHDSFGVELSLLDLFESRTVAAQTRLIAARLQGRSPPIDKPRTEYCFFGPAKAALFGALHYPDSRRGNTGVVLCYPMGQEYMRIHRTYVELARSLAASGRLVLRFDYFGCGDSAGERICGNLERWKDDIRQAIEELRRRTGAQEVYLVGARIGANLVLEVGSEEDLGGMVLWEPIVNGADYIAALRRAHRDLLASNAELDGYAEREQPDCFLELVGYPISRQLHDEMASIDLLAGSAFNPKYDSLVLANSDKPALKQYASVRKNGGAKLDYDVVNESDGIWLKEDRKNKGLIPVQAIHAIDSWIARRAV